jgi:acetyl-CoA carboxylase biotin carboxyl carrier protein
VTARELRRLADLLREYGLTEVEVEQEGARWRVRLRRDVVAPAAPAGPAAAAVPSPERGVAATVAPGDRRGEEDAANFLTIEAPMVGTFYRAPAPDALPYVREGDRIKKGQVVAIIEAMKLMNEIESKVAGRLAKILVENGQPVEYGQPLFLVEP